LTGVDGGLRSGQEKEQFFECLVEADVIKRGLSEHKLGLVELTPSEFGEFVFMVFGGS